MRCWPRTLLWLTIMLLGLNSMLTGCGQKGPLTLPDPAPATEQAADAESQKRKP